MKGEDLKLLIVAILAVVAIVLASFSIAFPKEDEEREEETNSPPTANINVETASVEEGEIIYFNGSASTDSDGIIIEYTWDFGDGVRDSGMYSNHEFSLYGTYEVRLTVIDDGGATDSDIIMIHVEGHVKVHLLPIAVIEVASTTVKEGKDVVFNGSGSIVYNGIIIDYTWDFGNGIKDSGMYSHYVFNNEGSYNISLTVLDDRGGTNTTEIEIIVVPYPQGSLQFKESSYNEGDFTGNFYSLSRSVNLSDVSMTIYDESKNESETQESIDPGTRMFVEEGVACTYFDDNEDGYLDQGDIILVEWGDTGDTIYFVYEPTGVVIAEYVFVSIPVTPTGALDFTESAQIQGLYTGSFVSLSKSVLLEDANMTITDTSLGENASLNPIESNVSIQISGGMNGTYFDNNANNKLDGGDTIRVYNIESGDRIKFIYLPTKQVFAQYTFV